MKGVGMRNKGYVLIVDDDLDARQILEKIFSSLGVECVTAADGASAIQIVDERRPALIMLDLMMPRMSGFEVLSHLRSIPATRSIPIIVVSAASGLETLKLPGVSSVISKASMRVADVRRNIAGLLDVDPSTTPDASGSHDILFGA